MAKRAGHSVAVLFRAYATFLTDGDDAANAKISAPSNRQDRRR
ncbi:hypothetical protein [Streptomyces cellostaticus]|nr:hypothetical protein [Streptomyces cellostaticus]